jgi:hypothetical protein
MLYNKFIIMIVFCDYRWSFLELGEVDMKVIDCPEVLCTHLGPIPREFYAVLIISMPCSTPMGSVTLN